MTDSQVIEAIDEAMSDKNAYVQEYLRLSRTEHANKMADAVSTLAEQLEKVTKQRDALEKALVDTVSKLDSVRFMWNGPIHQAVGIARAAIEKAKP